MLSKHIKHNGHTELITKIAQAMWEADKDPSLPKWDDLPDDDKYQWRQFAYAAFHVVMENKNLL